MFALFIVGVSSLAGVADVLKESCNFGVPDSSYSSSFLQLYLPAVIKVVTTNRYSLSMSPLEGRRKKPSPSGTQYSYNIIGEKGN